MGNTESYSIVGRIKEGDKGAFREIFRLYYPSIHTFITGFTKDPSLADDIAQDVFMKVWIYRNSLDAEMPIRSYLFLLARRQICSWFRRKLTLQKYIVELSEQELESIIEDGDLAETAELQAMAEEIIANMPDKRRMAFVLSRGKGLSSEDIAEIMNISPRTVHKHLELAMKTLRNKLKIIYE